MVACRITDARNITANNPHLQHMHSRSTGSLSGGQVPLKKYKQTRISSLTTILIAVLHWIWPPDRCTNCHSIYSSTHLQEEDEATLRRRSVSQIQRSLDGRFVVGDGTAVDKGKLQAITNGEADVDEVDCIVPRRHSNASQGSSSDDGGFLSRRSFISARASWRRPLVASPSQLSLQSAVGSAKGFLQGFGGLLRVGNGTGNGNNVIEEGVNSGARYQNVARGHYGYNIYRNLQPAQPTQPPSRPLHINTISDLAASLGHQHQHPTHMHDLITPNLYTPSKVSRIFSSSPASTPNGGISLGAPSHGHVNGLLTSPWAMTTSNANYHNHFSDLSTVYPSSAERSLPTSNTSGNLSRYRYYSHELPSLRTIQEETRRLNQQQNEQDLHHGFVPLQIPSPPSWRNYYGSMPYHSYRPRTRWYPRHYSRLFGRSQSELMSPLPHLNLSMRSASATGMGLEASPESRSSSSGFGSKNTSNHPHGSHHSGSTSEWRLLPPYRPPPPPPTANSAYFGSQHATELPETHAQQAQAQAPVHPQHLHHSHQQQQQHSYPYSPGSLGYYPHYSGSLQRSTTPPYTMENWLDMISRLNAATDNVNLPKSVDVGSVDGHYEFDPSTPTPSASTPTGGLLREDLNLHVDTTGHHHTFGPMSGGNIFHTHSSGMPPLTSGSATFGGHGRNTRISRYDNVEARLQAMKEEFYAYRKRQAMRRAGVSELESVC